jgi:hypothetical protein
MEEDKAEEGYQQEKQEVEREKVTWIVHKSRSYHVGTGNRAEHRKWKGMTNVKALVVALMSLTKKN